MLAKVGATRDLVALLCTSMARVPLAKVGATRDNDDDSRNREEALVLCRSMVVPLIPCFPCRVALVVVFADELIQTMVVGNRQR